MYVYLTNLIFRLLEYLYKSYIQFKSISMGVKVYNIRFRRIK